MKTQKEYNKTYEDKLRREHGVSPAQVNKYGFKLTVDVYEKWGKKCSVCGTENRLAIHHIDGSGQTESPNNDIFNLQLICISCHMSLHKKEQWKEKIEKQGGYLYYGKEKEYKKKMRRKTYLKKRDNKWKVRREVEIGDVVKWKCRPYTRPTFIAEGIVREIFISKRLGKSLKVECVGEYLQVFENRKRTTVAVHNLISTPKGEQLE